MKLYKKIENELALCIEDYLLTGALPSPIMEKPYGMMMSFQNMPKYNNEVYKDYIVNFMKENYFSKKYGGEK